MTHTQFLMIMQNHIGADKGVTAKALVAELTQAGIAINEREMRHTIEELRLSGHHICAHPALGYFMAETPAELDQTCKYLVDLSMASLKQVSAMKRVSVPDLYGQLRIPYEDQA